MNETATWVLVEQTEDEPIITASDDDVLVLWWDWSAWFSGDDKQRREMILDYRQMPTALRKILREARHSYREVA